MIFVVCGIDLDDTEPAPYDGWFNNLVHPEWGAIGELFMSSAQADGAVFWVSLFNFLNYFVLLGITYEGSVSEMHIWFILIIESDGKWCINLYTSLFLYFNYLLSVTAAGPESPREHMIPSSTRLRWIRSVLRASNFCV